jgi:hypothetical protein
VTHTAPAASLVFGLNQSQALVILFVILPFVLAAIIVPLVSWRSSKGPRPILTSEILSQGLPGRAEILSVRTLGSIIDVRPMVRFELRITPASPGEEPFEIEAVQSLPRGVISRYRPGDWVQVRFMPDRQAAAVVWAEPTG